MNDKKEPWTVMNHGSFFVENYYSNEFYISSRTFPH